MRVASLKVDVKTDMIATILWNTGLLPEETPGSDHRTAVIDQWTVRLSEVLDPRVAMLPVSMELLLEFPSLSRSHLIKMILMDVSTRYRMSLRSLTDQADQEPVDEAQIEVMVCLKACQVDLMAGLLVRKQNALLLQIDHHLLVRRRQAEEDVGSIRTMALSRPQARQAAPKTGLETQTPARVCLLLHPVMLHLQGSIQSV